MIRCITSIFLLIFAGCAAIAQWPHGQSTNPFGPGIHPFSHKTFPQNLPDKPLQINAQDLFVRESEMVKESNRNVLKRESIQLLNDTMLDCAGPTPRAMYWSENGKVIVANSIRANDGGIYVACDFVPNAPNTPIQPFIFKIDGASKVEWICPLRSNESFGFSGVALVQLADGGLLVSSGITKGNMDMESLVVKISSTGKLIWSQSFRSTSGTCNSTMTFFLSHFHELPGGDLVGAGTVYHCMNWGSGGWTSSVPVAVRLSPDGKIIWTKSVGSEMGDDPMYMITLGLLVSDDKISLITTSDFNRLVAWKMDLPLNGGTTITAQKIEPESANAAFIGTELSPSSLKVIQLADGKIRISSPTIGLNNNSNNPASQFGVLDLAADFSASEYRVLYSGFTYTEQAWFKNINLQKDGRMDFAMPNRSQHKPYYFISNFGANGTPIKQRQLFSHYDRGYQSTLLPEHNGMQHFVQTSGSFAGITPLGLQDGNSVCIGKDTSLLFWGDPKVAYKSSQPTPPTVYENTIISTTNSLSTNTTPIINKANVCRAFNLCNTLSILPIDTSICNLQKVNLKASLNAACDTRIFWQAEFPDSVDMVVKENNELDIQFKGRYTGWIYAEMNGACGLLRDSIWLSIDNFLPPLSLGPDLLFCPGRLNHLVATPGYKSYVWNNRTTADTLKIFTGGNYWVTATDHCGNIHSDTINVLPFLNLEFSAGTNIQLCAGDTATLMATKDYGNYKWEPDTGMQFPNSANPRVSPLRNTMYRVTTQAGPGCLLIDSVTVFVKYPTPFSLGTDLTTCEGESLLLKGPEGFKRFYWNNGDTTRETLVSKPGPYILKAAPDDGCLYSDTLILFNHPRPFERWDKNPVLCGGETRTFFGGNNLQQIIWNDGSNGPNLTVDRPGTYWVRVTDGYGCTYSDTAIITHIKPSPAHFLPADSTICSYASWQVNTLQPFSKYVWSTGDSSRGITIKNAGVYRLKVTDDEGCVGEDDVKVMVEKCPEGLFVPTAFTPNGDGINDFFRATLLGNVLSFEMSIYNRFGDLVFTSKDPKTGWLGTLKGKPQAAGTFIWQCRFQLNGKPIEFQKGTFLLIR